LARKKDDRPAAKSPLDEARDELFSHIHRCGVLQASEEQQVEWMQDTMQFMAERYSDLTPAQIASLGELGLRFCKPVIPHGQVSVSTDEDADAA
jgi:hypothetical protein